MATQHTVRVGEEKQEGSKVDTGFSIKFSLILKEIRKTRKVKTKDEVHPRTRQEGPEEKYRENIKVSFCSKEV